MSLEDKIIKKLNSSFLKSNKNLVGIGDDCAYLGKEDLLISTDTFIENTHFDLKKSNPPEIGILDINLTDKAKSDPLFLNFPNTFKALQWHSYEVQSLENNEDVHILGSSAPTKFQIFNYKNYAYGIQFHIEIKNDTVSNWGNVPEYKQALEDSLGEGSLDTMKIESDLHLKQMNDLSSSLYKNIINNFK